MKNFEVVKKRKNECRKDIERCICEMSCNANLHSHMLRHFPRSDDEIKIRVAHEHKTCSGFFGKKSKLMEAACEALKLYQEEILEYLILRDDEQKGASGNIFDIKVLFPLPKDVNGHLYEWHGKPWRDGAIICTSGVVIISRNRKYEDDMIFSFLKNN